MSEKFLELGFCARPHGIKGAFAFNLVNTQNSILKNGMKVLLKGSKGKSSLPEKGEVFTIAKIQFGNKTIVELVDITDRNTVEAMVPFSIWLNRNEFPKISENEVYLSDLVGLKVIDQNKQEIGHIVGIGTNGVQDILSIELSTKEIIELLFLEQFIREVNIESGVIYINLPELV